MLSPTTIASSTTMPNTSKKRRSTANSATHRWQAIAQTPKETHANTHRHPQRHLGLQGNNQDTKDEDQTENRGLCNQLHTVFIDVGVSDHSSRSTCPQAGSAAFFNPLFDGLTRLDHLHVVGGFHLQQHRRLPFSVARISFCSNHQPRWPRRRLALSHRQRFA
jgi:hypothetical protein